MKKFSILIAIFGLLFTLVAFACAPSPATTTPTATPPTTTSPSPVPPLTTKPGVQTIGQLAEAGRATFANRCAGCHGQGGQGGKAPVLVGTNANLGKYNTAQGLMDYISSAMPMNAPGSLPRQDYLNILCFLLLDNNYAVPESAFNESTLGNISLKK